MTTNRAYSDELRADSTLIVIPIISTITVALALIGLANFVRMGFGELWHMIVALIISPLSARAAWTLLQDKKSIRGTVLFLGTHGLLLTLVYAQTWQQDSALPYFFTILTVLAGMLMWPGAGFYAWNATTLVVLFVSYLVGELSAVTILRLLPAILLNLFVAVAVYLTALEWQTAVESVSVLHRRAQERRDELFAMKENLTRANDRLHYLNEQLELARQAAIDERDIRTRFMNNVSHELRSPLNVIVNFAHILDEGETVTARQSDYLKRIGRSGWHLLEVLNDLLDMAQIEAGEFKLQPEVDNLQGVCEEAVASVEGLVLQKENVRLITDFPQQWPLVKVDVTRMKQALINLLGNAAKYTDVGHIALRVRNNGHYVLLQVEDTGIGIPPEHQELIFQEFHQVDDNAARRRVGTGLGLPITKHLVERHGGRIGLQSVIGRGSRFVIALPLYHPENDAPATSEATP